MVDGRECAGADPAAEQQDAGVLGLGERPGRGEEAVTTVNGRSLGSASAMSCGVNPSSTKTVSASRANSAAAAAIRRFSGTWLVVRKASVVSKPALSTG